MYTLVKILMSAGLIVLISELAKRGGWMSALLATLPLTSLLAIVWLYVDTRDTQKIAALSIDIFWLVLPSLSFFIALPWLLRMRMNFWLSLAISLAIMFACYLLMMALLKKIGVNP
ncbi:DUF3147 family protein [Novimethylophilus kurashikiensis]|nr:DUF3147 family protein [Novimethylophilus kurashikiensis]